MSKQNFLWYLQVAQTVTCAAAGLFFFIARLKQGELRYNKTPFRWLLSVKLFVSISTMVMCATKAGKVPGFLTLGADALNVMLLAVQIDQLWPCTPMEKADSRLSRLAYLGSWAMIALYDILSTTELALSPHAPEFGFIATILRVCLGLSLFAVFIWPAGDGYIRLDPDITDHMRDINSEIKAAGGHWLWMKKFAVFLPWVWPSGTLRETLYAIISLIILALETAVVLSTPYLMSRFLKSLQTADNAMDTLWAYAIYEMARLSESSIGLSNLSKLFWKQFDLQRWRIAKIDVFARVMRHNTAFHITSNSTDTAAASDKTASVCGSLDFVVFETIPHAIKIIITTITIYSQYGPRIALVQWTATLLNFIVVLRMNRILTPIYEADRTSDERTNRCRQDALQGHLTVANNGEINREIAVYSAGIDEQKDLSLKSSNYTQTFMFQAGLVSVLCQTIAMAFIFKSIDDEPNKHIGDVVAFGGYWYNLQNSQAFFLTIHTTMMQKLYNADRLRRVLDIKPAIEFGTEKLRTCGGGIKFTNVSFNYINNQRKSVTVFRNLSFSIEPKKTTAFVGQSGVGKSTLLSLINRFFDPEGGSIEIDGQDIKTLQEGELPANISFMEQNPYIFFKSFAHNIGYGQKDISRQQMEEAARMADIDKVIQGHDLKYDAMVGENGSTLSGGERQRLALARTLSKTDRQIFMFDESTSALDAHTEDHIRKSIKAVGADRTTIIVAHRLSTIRHADKIIVFGRALGVSFIEQEGTHDQLVEVPGTYKNMWKKHIGED
ncbi:hypothetical protein ACHAPU_008058 [Fusarium lateritium]